MSVARSTSFLFLLVNNKARLLARNAACCWVALSLVLTGSVWADVYSYECDSVPVETGWTQVNASCGAEEWSENGLLYQEVPLCEEFPGFGAQFDYNRDIDDMVGLTSWFAEWRMMTTGSSEEIPFVAPAAFLAWDGNALLYHFTIADDTVRLIRDLALPILYFDIEVGVMHTFRIEVFGPDLGESYLVYINGEFVDGGEAEGPLFNPDFEAGVKFRAKSKIVPSVTTWDYIRWGEIPPPGSADFTLDGEVDFDDLPFFQECLTTEAGGWAGCAWCDMDGDVDVDCTDWALFLQAWTDPADPPCMLGCDCHPADFDGDGSVNAFDLAILLGNWGPCPDPPENCPIDLDGDGFVNAFDLAMLLGKWG